MMDTANSALSSSEHTDFILIGAAGYEQTACATSQYPRWIVAMHNRWRSRDDRWPGTLVSSRHARTLKSLSPEQQTDTRSCLGTQVGRIRYAAWTK